MQSADKRVILFSDQKAWLDEELFVKLKRITYRKSKTSIWTAVSADAHNGVLDYIPFYKTEHISESTVCMRLSKNGEYYNDWVGERRLPCLIDMAFEPFAMDRRT